VIGLGPGLIIDLLGWLSALALGVLAGWLWLRGARQRGALNRALHELRRPLQILTLMATSPRPQHARPSSPHGSDRCATGPAAERPAIPRSLDISPSLDVLEQAIGALADLDGAVNGNRAPSAARAVCIRESTDRLLQPWRALLGATELSFRWMTAEEDVLVDPVRFRQALENLIANSCEHGRLPIEVTAAALPTGVRLTVGDAGPAHRLDAAPGRNRRRGHGLAVAAEFAAASGGALRSWQTGGGGTVVALDLPLALPPRLPRPRARPPVAGPVAASVPPTQ